MRSSDSLKSRGIVDLADPLTWPDEMVAFIGEIRRDLSPLDLEALPLSLVQEDWEASDRREAQVLRFLQGRKLLLSHFTRLTPVEQEEVLEKGMRPLVPDMHLIRLQRACREAGIDDATLSTLRRVSPLADPHQHSLREGRLYGVAPLNAAGDDRGLRPFLADYGGESTFFWAGDHETSLSALRANSQPVIVQLAAPFESLCGRGAYWAIMLGQLAKLPDAWHEWYVTGACEVVNIVRKGDADWPTGDSTTGI